MKFDLAFEKIVRVLMDFLNYQVNFQKQKLQMKNCRISIMASKFYPRHWGRRTKNFG